MYNIKWNIVAVAVVLLAVIVAPPAVFAQEVTPEHGSVELGVRGISGEVDGRPDLSLRPSLFSSKFNEYRDLKNGVFVRSLQGTLDVGANSFVSVQSRSSILQDQSWLATGGRYGKYRVQFLFEETPHTFTNTARTLFTTTGNGLYQLSPGIRTQLFAAANVDPSLSTTVRNPALPSAQAAVLNPALFNATSALVPTASWVNPSLIRKAGAGIFSIDLTPSLDFGFQFSRERQTGTRPLGVLIGGGTEVPEPIDYTTNNFKLGTEYAHSSWGFQVGYQASYFNNNIGSVSVVNPYSPAPNSTVNIGQVIAGTDQCAPGAVAPACVAVNTTANGDVPATRVTIGTRNYTVGSVTGIGRTSLYPDNQAQNVNFAGRFDLTKSVHVVASIVPGWMSQNQTFLPYTTNLTAGPSPALPVSSLDGSKQTLAMNYVVSTSLIHKLGLTAKYRSYDYNNNTPTHDFYTNFVQDQAVPATLPGATEISAYGFNRKTAELAATYALGKSSSAKVGYELEMMDRQHRDVSSTQENSLFASLDSNLGNKVSLRLSYRHSDRTTQGFNYDSEDPNYAFARANITLPNGSTQMAASRRFDEAPRFRDGGDVLLQYSPLDKLTVSASWGTVQDDYNRRLGNQVPFGNIGGTGPFYTYGLLKDLSTNYGFDGTYVVSKNLSLFGEYTREKYFTRMVSEQIGNLSGVPVYDTINDWTSQNRNRVDTWAAGVDTSISKLVSVSTFYSLSAATGNTIQGGVNCVVGTIGCRTNNTHWFLDGPIVDATGAILINPATGNPYSTTAPLYWGGGPTSGTYGLNFPEAVSRLHQVVATMSFKISKSLTPKFEYRFERFDDLNYQTASNPQFANPYAGGLNPYMYGGVGIDPNSVTGTNKYLFLGADTPSYHAHVFAATLEYRF